MINDMKVAMKREFSRKDFIMGNDVLAPKIDDLYKHISEMVYEAKKEVYKKVNHTIIDLNWNIGKLLVVNILKGEKAEYGKDVVGEISSRLTQEYGKGFDKKAVFKMIQFYQEFPDYEKVAILSRQLTWSHFVELLPIKDELQREFYATLCKNENWAVHTLRERKKSMLYERTAISKKPEETIANELSSLRDERKMSVDMFYRDPYMLDFLGLKDTYSEKDLCKV